MPEEPKDYLNLHPLKKILLSCLYMTKKDRISRRCLLAEHKDKVVDYYRFPNRTFEE